MIFRLQLGPIKKAVPLVHSKWVRFSKKHQLFVSFISMLWHQVRNKISCFDACHFSPWIFLVLYFCKCYRIFADQVFNVLCNRRSIFKFVSVLQIHVTFLAIICLLVSIILKAHVNRMIFGNVNEIYYCNYIKTVITQVYNNCNYPSNLMSN